MLATGHPAAMTTAPGSEDEMRKRITAMLLAGTEFVFIDNLVGQLRSESLAAAITATSWKDRLLGRSEMLELPQRAIWVATGNNIQVRGDLPRRCFWVRLDAGIARPWLPRRLPSSEPDGLGDRPPRRSSARAAHALPSVVGGRVSAGRHRPARHLRELDAGHRWRPADGRRRAASWATSSACTRRSTPRPTNGRRSSGAWRETFTEPVTTAQVRRALDDSTSDLSRPRPTTSARPWKARPAATVVRLSKALTARVGQRFGRDNLRLERAAGDRRKKLARWRVAADSPAGGAEVAGIDEPLF